MACFLVPAAEAVITTIVQKAVKNKESAASDSQPSTEIKFSEKLGWLNKMLWGGSGLLAFEHLWHGEITPFFPFLTAVSNPSDMTEMLAEMATSGVGMALLVTAVWGVAVAVSHKIQNKEISVAEVEEAAKI